MKKFRFLLILLLPLLAIVVYNIYNFILIDTTAREGSDVFFWHEIKYVPSGFAYREGRTIAKTSDGTNINEVVGDYERNSVVLRNWIDQTLYVREDYQVITKGKITTVTTNLQDITADDLCEALEIIILSKWDTFIYETDNLGYDANEIEIYFEHSPLGVRKYIGFIDNKWVYIDSYVYTPDTDDLMRTFVANCKVIDEQCASIIERYIEKKNTSDE